MTKIFKTSLALFLAAATLSCSTGGKTDDRKQKFDYDWSFHLGDEPAAAKPDFDDSGWRKLNLPHDWSIEAAPDSTNPMGNAGGYFPAGIGWYRKTFDLPASLEGKKLSLYFEGVMANAEVFVNGTSLGVRPYGYSAFRHDITPHVTVGGRNTVAVRVDNAGQPIARWYSGSGIYRHVWLTATDPVHIAPWGVAVSTPEADDGEATVRIAATVQNESDGDRQVDIQVRIRDAEGKAAAGQQARGEIPAGGEMAFDLGLSVSKPQLWSPDAPVLYSALVTVSEKGKMLDEISVPFGIRTIAYSAETGFLLNGKEITINGGCLHHDNGPLGAAAYDRAEQRKAELMKAAGFNAVRTAHNPPSEAFLDACDRVGLLVMDESFDGWRTAKTRHDYAKHFDQWWDKDITAMVMRDRNHPSIVCWSTGNEVYEVVNKGKYGTDAEATETSRKLAERVRQIDPTRPVTQAVTNWGEPWESFDAIHALHDIAGYNYQLLYHAEKDHKRVPDRILFQTESEPEHAFAIWKLVSGNRHIIGDFVWTAMDYLGEAGIGRYYYVGETEGGHERNQFPMHGAYCGDIDLIGQRKAISHYRDLLYNEGKKLYMAVREPNGYHGEIRGTRWSVWPTWESWNWPGHEGRDIEVEVISRHPAVRLYMDDQPVGERTVSAEEGFKAVFTLPYQPGTLRAVGLADGEETGESITLRTAGPATGIRLVADRAKLAADGQDLSFVTVEIVDKDGNIVPNADHRIAFELEGPGTIAATANARLRDPGTYQATERNARNGRALAVVRSGRSSGKIVLKASSPGLQPAQAAITTN